MLNGPTQMVKINRKVEYSLMILKHMSDHGKGVDKFSVRDLSDTYKIPFDTASKVLQTLNKKSIVESVKGIKGGYYLNSDLKNISYLELAELVEGKKHPKNCNEQQCILLENCNISTPITNLNSYILNLFENISVHDILYKNINQIPLKASI